MLLRVSQVRHQEYGVNFTLTQMPDQNVGIEPEFLYRLCKTVLRDMLLDHMTNIEKYGEGMPEIRD